MADPHGFAAMLRQLADDYENGKTEYVTVDQAVEPSSETVGYQHVMRLAVTIRATYPADLATYGLEPDLPVVGS